MKFEYKEVQLWGITKGGLTIKNRLNILGNCGWELVGINCELKLFYFKRQLE